LDTGSTDGTWDALQAAAVRLPVRLQAQPPAPAPQLHLRQQVFTPWRFDTARNAALAMVPGDVDLCVICDMDERFPPGWRAKLETLWRAGTHRMQVRYVFSWRPDGSPDVVFYMTRIHARHGYTWTHPVHECLKWTGAGLEVATNCDGLELHHYQNRATSRAQYLPLLELAVKEDPNNDRNAHYLGREYIYAGRWQEAVTELQRHLALPSATWPAERAASMAYIAQALEQLGRPADAEAYYMRACAEYSDRDNWLAFALFCVRRRFYAGAYAAACRCLQQTDRPLNYMSSSASWGALPHDVAALAAFHLGLAGPCLQHYADALKLAPNDGRLKADFQFCQTHFAKAG
jgi:tetratricopeptide (TPR) repeat protein